MVERIRSTSTAGTPKATNWPARSSNVARFDRIGVRHDFGLQNLRALWDLFRTCRPRSETCSPVRLSQIWTNRTRELGRRGRIQHARAESIPTHRSATRRSTPRGTGYRTNLRQRPSIGAVKMHDWPIVELTLEPSPDSVGLARLEIERLAVDVVGQEAAEVARLLVSELATNAVLYGASPTRCGSRGKRRCCVSRSSTVVHRRAYEHATQIRLVGGASNWSKNSHITGVSAARTPASPFGSLSLLFRREHAAGASCRLVTFGWSASVRDRGSG